MSFRRRYFEGEVTSPAIVPEAVTEEKIANEAVTSQKIKDNTIQSVDIGAGQIRTEDIADGAVTAAKLGNDVTLTPLPDNAVTTAKIASQAVTTDKLQDGGVTPDKIQAGAVGSLKLADSAVTQAKIATGAVTSSKLQATSVTSDKMALSARRSAINFVMDGGSNSPATGSKGYLHINNPCVIEAVALIADQSGSAVVDIKKCALANFPATASICASAKPTLSTAQIAEDTTLTGWTTALAAGDVLEINLDSVSTCLRLTVVIHIYKN